MRMIRSAQAAAARAESAATDAIGPGFWLWHSSTCTGAFASHYDAESDD